jgi:DnaJ-class molecular chaperone
MILEVDQTAGLELIIKSYRQLALKLHPDRNPSCNTTAEFQRVCQIQTCAHHYVGHG